MTEVLPMFLVICCWATHQETCCGEDMSCRLAIVATFYRAVTKVRQPGAQLFRNAKNRVHDTHAKKLKRVHRTLSPSE